MRRVYPQGTAGPARRGQGGSARFAGAGRGARGAGSHSGDVRGRDRRRAGSALYDRQRAGALHGGRAAQRLIGGKPNGKQKGKVAVVERAEAGGVCLNWGCIPTKALLKSAQVYMENQELKTETKELKKELGKMKDLFNSEQLEALGERP